ncbi:2252_t:CDS:2 [Entrophospora sp. SA101]|nr:2252_t:CDS:2 [Entrophospora sp. SA101]
MPKHKAKREQVEDIVISGNSAFPIIGINVQDELVVENETSEIDEFSLEDYANYKRRICGICISINGCAGAMVGGTAKVAAFNYDSVLASYSIESAILYVNLSF